MNTSAFWIIILSFWVFTLQSKIKHLEDIVEGLLDKHKRKEPVPKKKYLKEEPHILENETSMKARLEKVKAVQKVEVPREEVKEKEYTSAVSQFKTLNSTSKSTTGVVYPKEEYVHTEPSWLMQMLTNYFTGGNLLVRIGGVILFFGLAFLVKYAAEHTTISMEFRLGSVALVAVGLIMLGWKLREKEGAYGQILQGLGVAVLYLVIYGAAKFYTLLSLESAFVLMLVVVVLGSFLALKQSSLPLALFSTTGGFLVPILTSAGEGSHVVLFSYYFVLNLGIFFMAWKQTWRVLNIVGFLFTFVIVTSWGVLRYSPELFSSTEPFLILYFLMYLTITILFAGKSKGHLVDGALLFGLPAVVFPLQVQLVSHIEYGAGISAVVMGSLYLLLAKVLKGKTPSKLLLQSFFGLGVLLYTVAIPYFFDADITAAIWAMESAAVIWLSLKQKRVFVRYFGELLLFVSVGLYLVSQIDNAINFSVYLGYTIVTFATFFAAYQLQKHKEYLGADKYLSGVFLLLSFAVWMASVWEVAVWVEAYMFIHKILLGFILGTMLIALADKILVWQLLGKVLQATLLVGVVLFIGSFIDIPYPLNPFGGLGAIAFLALMVWHTIILYRYDKLWQFAKYLHILSLWFAVAILTLALRYVAITSGASSTMILLSTGILPLLSAFALMRVNLSKVGLSEYMTEYRYIGTGGLLLFLLLWNIQALSYVPDFLQNYLPLLNLLDIMQIVILGIFGYWFYMFRENFDKVNRDIFFMALGALSLILLSVVFARAVHMYQDVPYQLSALWANLYFQTGLSLLWSAVAIVLMLLSKRYVHRVLWLAGFGLLGLVVLKLFFVELASSGTIERIISFMVVGTLLLLIGYFMPLPPNQEKIDNQKEKED